MIGKKRNRRKSQNEAPAVVQSYLNQQFDSSLKMMEQEHGQQTSWSIFSSKMNQKTEVASKKRELKK